MNEKNNVYSADHAYKHSESDQFMNVVIKLFTDNVTIDLVIVTDHTIAKADLETILTELQNNKLKKMRLNIETDVLVYVDENGNREKINIMLDGDQVKLR